MQGLSQLFPISLASGYQQRRQLNAEDYARKVTAAQAYLEALNQAQLAKLHMSQSSREHEKGYLTSRLSSYQHATPITRWFHKWMLNRHLNRFKSPGLEGRVADAALVPAHAIMFGLMLFSLVLMLSQPRLTGFTILNLPVIVNWPFVLGLAIFILDLIAIERWYVSSPKGKPAARSSRK